MDTSDVLSVIAIVIAILSAVYQWRNDMKLNTINLEAEYFKKIYEEHLLYKLPQARKYIFFQGNRLKDYEKLMDELNEIRNASLYFLYSDKKFYDELKLVLQDLEDYLGNCGNQEITDGNQEIVLKEIQEKIQEIYSTIIRKYHGKM